MTTRYIASYDPDTDFDRWHTVATSRHIVAQIQPDQCVLELGCATGLMTKDLAATGASVLAVDRAEPYLDRAKARGLANVEFELADIVDFKADRKFDHVVATNVLHEVPDPAVFLRNCRRHLAPGGTLHITLQNPHSIHRLVGVELGLINDPGEISKRGQDYDTLRMLDRDALVELFTAGSLEVASSQGVLLKPLPNSLMENLPEELIDGLARVGRHFPKNCSMNYFGLHATDRRAQAGSSAPVFSAPAVLTPPQPDPTTIKKLQSQTVPDTQAQHLSLWNTLGFFSLRPNLLDTYLRLDHRDEAGRLIGSIVGSLNGSRFVSGSSAPMGGVDLVRKYEPVEGIEDLLRSSLTSLVKRGVTEMEVRMKGPHFSESEPGIGFALLNAGFETVESNLNFYVDLRPFRTVGDYYNGLKKPARRGIDAGNKLGLTSDLLAIDDVAGWSEAYDVLHENRASKGRPTSLTLEYVLAIRNAFPGLVRMIAIRDKNAIIGSALVYRVAAGRDVVQFWGDARHDLPSSPMNYLVNAVVEHGLATGCEFLDLGISTEHGEANHGLIKFKRSIGANSEIRSVLVHRDLRSALR